MAKALKGEVVTDFLIFVKNKKRENGFYMSTSAVPIKDSEGVITGAITVIRDVTKERDIDKAKTEFVSLASHQLRTPLSTINWYAEMLMAGGAGKMNEGQKKYLDEIYNGNKRMIVLVNAILSVSKIEMGTFSIEPQPTDIINIAKRVLSELPLQVQAKRLKIMTEFDENLGLLNVDPKLMEMIFQNLFENAVKYIPPGGRVEVKIKKDETDVLISVFNSGSSISEKDKNKIFTKFYRTTYAREIDSDGTGLGLYIVKSVLEKSGGKIWFESGDKDGVTFYVKIPQSGMNNEDATKKT